MFGWVSLGELLSSGQSGAIGDLLPFSRGGYFLYFLAFSTQQSLGQMLIDPNWPSDQWESKAKITVLLKGGLNFEKSSRVSYIFSKAFYCPVKENVNLKIFGWEKKSPWEPYLEHYFSILEFSASKLQFLMKYIVLAILGVLEVKIAVLRVFGKKVKKVD